MCGAADGDGARQLGGDDGDGVMVVMVKVGGRFGEAAKAAADCEDVLMRRGWVG